MMNEQTTNKNNTQGENNMDITKTEKRVLTSFHMQGHMGKCGSLNKKQRLGILKGLIKKGLLDDNCQITRQGIKAAKPQFV